MSAYFSSELIRIKGIIKGFRKSLGQIVVPLGNEYLGLRINIFLF